MSIRAIISPLLVAGLAAPLFADSDIRLEVETNRYNVGSHPSAERKGFQLRFVIDSGSKKRNLNEYLYEYGLDAESRDLAKACQDYKFPSVTVYSSLFSQEIEEDHSEHYSEIEYCHIDQNSTRGEIRRIKLPGLGDKITELRNKLSDENYNQDSVNPEPEFLLPITPENEDLLPYYATYPLAHPRLLKEVFVAIMTEGPFTWKDGFTPAWLLKGHAFAAASGDPRRNIILTSLLDEDLERREADHAKIWEEMNKVLREDIEIERFRTAYGERSSLTRAQLAARGFRPPFADAENSSLDLLSVIYGSPKLIAESSANLGVISLGVISLSAESHFGLSTMNFLDLISHVTDAAQVLDPRTQTQSTLPDIDAIGLIELESCYSSVQGDYQAVWHSIEEDVTVFSPSSLLWYVNKDYIGLGEMFADRDAARAAGFAPRSAQYLNHLLHAQWERIPNYRIVN